MNEFKKCKKILGQLNEEIKKIEDEIKSIKAKTEEYKRKNEAIRNEIILLQAENNIMLKERGWEGITNEEMEWVMNKKDSYFNLKLFEIRKMIANEKLVTNSN